MRRGRKNGEEEEKRNFLKCSSDGNHFFILSLAEEEVLLQVTAFFPHFYSTNFLIFLQIFNFLLASLSLYGKHTRGRLKVIRRWENSKEEYLRRENKI